MKWTQILGIAAGTIKNNTEYGNSNKSYEEVDTESGNDLSDEMTEDGPEMFYVDKIIDIRWERNQNGQEEPRYRVRWHGYKASHDSWEPKESFEPCPHILQAFLDTFESMKAEHVAHLQSMGVTPTETEARNVNILSPHIQRITQKSSAGKRMLYRVVWEENNATWEDEDALKHATNKIDEYRVHMRLSRLKVQAKRREKKEEERRKAEAAAARDDSDCAKHSQQRKCFKKLENDQQIMSQDMYSRIKTRQRSPSDSQDNDDAEDRQSKKPSKYLRKEQSGGASNYNEENKENTAGSSTGNKFHQSPQPGTSREYLEAKEMQQRWQLQQHQHQGGGGGSDDDKDYHDDYGDENMVRLIDGLPEYNPDEVEEEFKRMEMETAILTGKEFQDAVYANNYELVFSALRSNNVPDVNFTCLFLDMTRRCKRDMAILLASRVPDLTVLDLWGENALTLAARHGDISFAYSLLQHGIPLNLCNSLGQTAYDVACLYKNVEFQAFCITFAEIQKVPLK
ncbi:uncharacterized protein LOC123512696 [Portunus trituberculatus]|uniref:uncharacterized protein LOC123512696 n=1 Tax=Portunus trituberculatus TaxID=210409 RepID=UPI001E1D08FC|nr:uncharacterized protein LOC123512696 [Portunus trituberculatus]